MEGPHNPRLRRAFVVAFLTVNLATQAPPKDRPEPIALVNQAEQLLQKKETEDAILMLWQALDELAQRPSNPVHEATSLSARFLLSEHDPREMERRRVFASVAKQQVELATAYRGKKWLQVAASRLEVADRYDRDIGAKERALLLAAKPKDPKVAQGQPPAAPEPGKPGLSPLLQRANTPRIFGEWREVGDCLESCAQTGNEGYLLEWVPSGTHADQEIIVEWKATEPTKDHNLGIWVGFDEERVGRKGYRAQVQYHPEARSYEVSLSEYPRDGKPDLASKLVEAPIEAGGFHRLSVQVRGTQIHVELDSTSAISANTEAPVRGQAGLFSGVAAVACGPIQYRNFRIDPLPADLPSDEEVRAKAAADNQNAITQGVDAAKDLINKKQPEAASLRLRDVLTHVDDMAAGVLRDNLKKSIEQMLTQTDSIAAKRKKAAQAISAELAALADQYATAGLVRAGLAIAQQASAFDEAAQVARIATLREKVQQWTVTQSTARASELAPPNDDGTALREWFAKGRKLDGRSSDFVIDGAVARSPLLQPDDGVGWLPHAQAKALTKASVHVQLPAVGADAGLMFDVIDRSLHGVVLLSRRVDGLLLSAYLKVGNKWIPLLHRPIAMDVWRRDGWHQITIENTETGLVAKCGTAEIKVARKLLGKQTGVVGLFAGNNGTATVAVEMRAFQPGQ